MALDLGIYNIISVVVHSIYVAYVGRMLYRSEEGSTVQYTQEKIVGCKLSGARLNI